MFQNYMNLWIKYRKYRLINMLYELIQKETRTLKFMNIWYISEYPMGCGGKASKL